MIAGSIRDVEGDEGFLGISGTGRLEFDEPARPASILAPGSLVRLDDGMNSGLPIDKALLRKLFIAPADS